MMRLYIAGPMSNLPQLNFPAFHAEAARLRALGYDIVNPAEINCGTSPAKNATLEEKRAWWLKCMKADIAQLMTCDGIALLPGWKNSKGAKIERTLAISLEMMICDAADLTEALKARARTTDWAAA